MQQMAKDGHLIGVHCMAHVDLARQPIEKSVEEIRETADWIEASRENVRNTYVRRMVHGVRSFRRECR